MVDPSLKLFQSKTLMLDGHPLMQAINRDALTRYEKKLKDLEAEKLRDVELNVQKIKDHTRIQDKEALAKQYQ